MFNKRATLALLSTVSLALPFAASAQSQTQLESKFSTFFGQDNSKWLVTALREAKPVTLTDANTTTNTTTNTTNTTTNTTTNNTTTFTPPTGKMSKGNVNIALSLAEARLKQQGVTNPTPDQIKDALSDILQQRADHKGWGEIAKSMDMKLGDVMRSERADKVARDGKARAERPERTTRVARAERPERPEKPERAEKPERPERAERGR
jgi:hypothetical protein